MGLPKDVFDIRFKNAYTMARFTIQDIVAYLRCGKLDQTYPDSFACYIEPWQL